MIMGNTTFKRKLALHLIVVTVTSCVPFAFFASFRYVTNVLREEGPPCDGIVSGIFHLPGILSTALEGDRFITEPEMASCSLLACVAVLAMAAAVSGQAMAPTAALQLPTTLPQGLCK